MNGLEALEEIKCDMEYVTRLDFVEPIVRGEVRDNLFKIYHKELPHLDTIEKELKAIEIIKKKVDERRIVLKKNFDNKFSLGGLEPCDLTYSELATILECFDFENIKVVDGEIQILSIRS